LIIFMAALPSMRKAIDIQLPDPNPPPQQSTPNPNQIVLEVQADGSYSINTKRVPHDALGPELKSIFDPRPEKIIFVKGDPKVKYGDVIYAMDVARGAGVVVIGIPPKDIPG